MRTIEVEVATLSLLEGKIVSIRFKEHVTISRASAEELLNGILELNPDIGPRLVFYNPSISFDFDAVKFLAKSKNANAIAIVNKSHKSMHILKVLLKSFTVMKAGYQMRFFDNEQDAKDWLRQLG